MANLTITITTDTGSVSKTTPDINNTQLQRLLDYLWEEFPQTETQVIDEEPVIIPKDRTPATEADAFRDWATLLWSQLKQNIKEHEATIAVQAAESLISDIEEL